MVCFHLSQFVAGLRSYIWFDQKPFEPKDSIIFDNVQLAFVHCPIFIAYHNVSGQTTTRGLPTNRTVFALIRTIIDKAGRQIII